MSDEEKKGTPGVSDDHPLVVMGQLLAMGNVLRSLMHGYNRAASSARENQRSRLDCLGTVVLRAIGMELNNLSAISLALHDTLSRMDIDQFVDKNGEGLDGKTFDEVLRAAIEAKDVYVREQMEEARASFSHVLSEAMQAAGEDTDLFGDKRGPEIPEC